MELIRKDDKGFIEITDGVSTISLNAYQVRYLYDYLKTNFHENKLVVGDMFEYFNPESNYKFYGKVFKVIKYCGQYKIFYEKVVKDSDGIFHTCDTYMVDDFDLGNFKKIKTLPFDFDWGE